MEALQYASPLQSARCCINNTSPTPKVCSKLLSNLKILTIVYSSLYNISILSEKMDKIKYETLNFGFNKSPPLSRPTSPLNHHDVDAGGYKYWHLVRHNEH